MQQLLTFINRCFCEKVVPGLSLSMTMENYVEIREIGHGAFGKVYHAKRRATQEDFVIKKINSDLLPAINRIEATREVEVLKHLQHENIVSYIESFEEKGCLHIVMTYCSEGNLAQKIHKRAGKLFTEPEVVTIFRQLCQAVDFMHKKNILHRDIKPENIFLTSLGVVKLGDFGLAKILDTNLQYARSLAGTFVFMSPEILHGKQYKNKSDMWSLGCVLYELTALQPAFTSIAGIICGRIPRIPTEYSNDLQDLTGKLLSIKPEDRPSANEILSLGFIREDNDIPKESTLSTISDFDLFLVGGRGNGRSATGNTILGIHGAFRESGSFEPDENVTTEVKWCKRGHLIIKVVDGPSLKDLSKPAQAFTHCHRGFHALLYVLNFASPRLTQEDKFIIGSLKEHLGKDVFRDNGILIVTHGECFDLYTSQREWMTFDTWVKKQEGDLGALIEECGNRVVLFYNLTPRKHDESVNILISMVYEIRKFFTCDFLKSASGRHRDHKLEVDGMTEEIIGRTDLCVNALRSYLQSQQHQDYKSLRNVSQGLIAEIETILKLAAEMNKNKKPNPVLVNIMTLVNPIVGKELLTNEKLQDILYDLQKIQGPYRKTVVKTSNSHDVARCCLS